MTPGSKHLYNVLFSPQINCMYTGSLNMWFKNKFLSSCALIVVKQCLHSY